MPKPTPQSGLFDFAPEPIKTSPPIPARFEPTEQPSIPVNPTDAAEKDYFADMDDAEYQAVLTDMAEINRHANGRPDLYLVPETSDDASEVAAIRARRDKAAELVGVYHKAGSEALETENLKDLALYQRRLWELGDKRREFGAKA